MISTPFANLRPLSAQHELRFSGAKLMPCKSASLVLSTATIFALLVSFLLSGSVWADCIEDLVYQVSEARLRAHVEALEFPRADPLSQSLASYYIVGELASYGYTVTFDPVQTSENIIARRFDSGGPAESLIVLGAHFDTVPGSPGADDNASGVAGMLEIARVLAATQTEIPIEFVGFALEELGLLGSLQYAQQASLAGVDIVEMICLDAIGYTCAEPGCQYPFNDIPGCMDVEPEGVNVTTYFFSTLPVSCPSGSEESETQRRTSIRRDPSGDHLTWKA